jgi:hypothetical protein
MGTAEIAPKQELHLKAYARDYVTAFGRASNSDQLAAEQAYADRALAPPSAEQGTLDAYFHVPGPAASSGALAAGAAGGAAAGAAGGAAAGAAGGAAAAGSKRPAQGGAGESQEGNICIRCLHFDGRDVAKKGHKCPNKEKEVDQRVLNNLSKRRNEQRKRSGVALRAGPIQGLPRADGGESAANQ